MHAPAHAVWPAARPAAAPSAPPTGPAIETIGVGLPFAPTLAEYDEEVADLGDPPPPASIGAPAPLHATSGDVLRLAM